MQASRAIRMSVLAVVATIGSTRNRSWRAGISRKVPKILVHDGVGGLNAIQAGGTWMTTGDYNGALESLSCS